MGMDGGWLRAQRRAHGWDVPEMARQLARSAADARGSLPDHDCLVRYIRRWERGSTGVSERYRILYARAFGVPAGELNAVTGTTPGIHPGDSYAPEIAAVIGRALHAAGRVQDTPDWDLATVQRDVVRAWQLRQSAQYAELSGLLAGLLQNTAAYLEASRDGERVPGTVNAAVHAHNTASSLLKRLEAFEMAAIAADRAFRIARQAGDGLLVGAATLRLANVFLSGSRYGEAVETAARGADELSPRIGAQAQAIATFGALLLTAAVAAARMGEAAQAWEFLGHAKSAASGMEGEHAGLFAVFGPVNLAIHGVQVATDLGDSREALRRAELVDVGRLPAALIERRSTLLIDIARSQDRQGDHGAAGATLVEAERLAPLEVRYNGVALSLLAGLLSSRGASADVREMAARVSAAA
jgi:transcriptional regulator with XRE-family HTH domain